MKIAEATLAPAAPGGGWDQTARSKRRSSLTPHFFATPRAMEINLTSPAFWLSVGQIDPDRHPAWRGQRGGDRAGRRSGGAHCADLLRVAIAGAALPEGDEAAQALKPMRAALDAAGVPYTVRQEVGHVAQTILRCASEFGASRIVMGRRGLSALVDRVLGSVASDVSAQAHVPVMLVQ